MEQPFELNEESDQIIIDGLECQEKRERGNGMLLLFQSAPECGFVQIHAILTSQAISFHLYNIVKQISLVSANLIPYEPE